MKQQNEGTRVPGIHRVEPPAALAHCPPLCKHRERTKACLVEPPLLGSLLEEHSMSHAVYTWGLYTHTHACTHISVHTLSHTWSCRTSTHVHTCISCTHTMHTPHTHHTHILCTHKRTHTGLKTSGNPPSAYQLVFTAPPAGPWSSWVVRAQQGAGC